MKVVPLLVINSAVFALSNVLQTVISVSSFGNELIIFTNLKQKMSNIIKITHSLSPCCRTLSQPPLPPPTNSSADQYSTWPPWMPGVISALYCRLCYCALTHPPSLPLSTKHTLCLSVRATSFLVLRYFPVFSHRVPVSFSFIFFLFFCPSHPLLFTSVCPSPTVVFEDKQWRFRRCINVSKRKKERTGE